MRVVTYSLGIAALAAWSLPAAPQSPTSAEAISFFESEIRPIFHTRCSQCHNDQLRTSGLSLATREGLMEGGNRGPAISLDRPPESLILMALRQSESLSMPPDGKMADARIASVERWIELGAPWPQASSAPSAGVGPSTLVISTDCTARTPAGLAAGMGAQPA